MRTLAFPYEQQLAHLNHLRETLDFASSHLSLVKRNWLALIWIALLLAAAGLGSAQEGFTRGTYVQVWVNSLNVRAAPGTGSNIVSQQQQGAAAVVTNATPHWADGYWWWNVVFEDGTEGWVAEGDASTQFVWVPAPPEFGPLSGLFTPHELWTSHDFLVAVYDGMPTRCVGRNYTAGMLRDVVFETGPCPADAVIPEWTADNWAASWAAHRPMFQVHEVLDISNDRLYFVDFSVAAIRGSAGMSHLLIFVQRSGASPYLVANIAVAGYTASRTQPELRVPLGIHLDGDANCCPSFTVEQDFNVTLEGITLVRREVILNPNGGLARQLVAPQHASANTVSQIMTDVSRVALDDQLEPQERVQAYRELQTHWAHDVFAMAVRIMPVQDVDSGRWRSFDSWARSEAQHHGADAPFYRDPVGSAVNLFFNPSVENISRQLGLPWDW